MQSNFLIYKFNSTNLRNMFEGEDSILAGGGEKYEDRNEMVKKLAKELEPNTFKSLGGNPLLGVDSKGKEELMKDPKKIEMIEALVDNINLAMLDKSGNENEEKHGTEESEKKLIDEKDYN